MTSTFFRRNDEYFVRTDGPDGQPHEYKIVYTFGVDPLQQYLIEFPMGVIKPYASPGIRGLLSSEANESREDRVVQTLREALDVDPENEAAHPRWVCRSSVSSA